MGIRYIDEKPHTLLASARRAAPPFCEQHSGDLVGCDFTYYDGTGECNARFTREQATALRDVLHVFLTCGESTIIAKGFDGKLVTAKN